MTLATAEFIRRFLMHVLPKGLHRIRHYGLFANAKNADAEEPEIRSRPCQCCGGRMIVIETFERGCQPRYRPPSPKAPMRIDTS